MFHFHSQSLSYFSMVIILPTISRDFMGGNIIFGTGLILALRIKSF